MTSASPRISPLLSSFSASSLNLRNRFAMAPMTRGKSPDGIPNAENVEYYRQRAAGGVGLIITEGTYIDDPAAGKNVNVPRFHGEDSAAGWKAVVEAVHAEGAAIIPQLWHVGSERGLDATLNPGVAPHSPSGLALSGDPLGEELSVAQIDAVIAAFAEAASLARGIGFDGIELHGAHGYLLDEFLWERTNRRADGYGGSRSARASVPAEVVRAVRDAVGPDFAIVFRYSQWKAGNYRAQLADDPAELGEVLLPLADAGVDVFHVSTRRHWLPAFPDLEEGGAAGPHATRGLAGWTKQVTGKPVITVGAVGVDTVFASDGSTVDVPIEQRLDILVEQFESGEFDVVAMGRALLADPAWVEKMSAGTPELVTAFSTR
jgi:2,4-dienoyl-CoA reductase-like NADH-dependent reductase (Old Yellow Enzyme family)